MNRKEHNKIMLPLCRELNKMIPIKGNEDKDKINATIYEVIKKVPDFGLYWDRELYINCGCNDDKVRQYTLHSGKVHFEPSEDPIEHPGITIRYNDYTTN
jgi:hypothetical protein